MNISHINYNNIHILLDIPFVCLSIFVIRSILNYFSTKSNYNRINLKNTLLKNYENVCI